MDAEKLTAPNQRHISRKASQVSLGKDSIALAHYRLGAARAALRKKIEAGEVKDQAMLSPQEQDEHADEEVSELRSVSYCDSIIPESHQGAILEPVTRYTTTGLQMPLAPI